MKIEIWSDIQCPFCYIGKRRFEEALAEFEHKDAVQIQWKSFQLNPDLKTDTQISISQYLADHKGWTLEYAQQMNQGVTDMAEQVGLKYYMENAVVANTFDAHQFAHAAHQAGKGNEAAEALFRAYFTEGKNIADRKLLANLGTAIGLDAIQVEQDLTSNRYADAVLQDMYEAQVINITGVPFFVFNDKYAISGAQPAEVFLQALQKAYGEMQHTPVIPEATDNNFCTPDGSC